MAEKEFPVVLHKDGQKRTAHSPIAYNQLKTQGFTEAGSKGRAQSAKAAQKAKPEQKAGDKPAETKAETKAAEKPAEKTDSK